MSIRTNDITLIRLPDPGDHLGAWEVGRGEVGGHRHLSIGPRFRTPKGDWVPRWARPRGEKLEPGRKYVTVQICLPMKEGLILGVMHAMGRGLNTTLSYDIADYMESKGVPPIVGGAGFGRLYGQ